MYVAVTGCKRTSCRILALKKTPPLLAAAYYRYAT